MHLFFHVCCLGQWQAILGSMVNILKEGDLLENMTTLTFGVLGSEADLEQFHQEMKAKSIGSYRTHHHPNLKLYEDFTLNLLYEATQSMDPMTPILYLHTKGVTRGTDQKIKLWRDYLLHYTVRKWRTCVEALKTHDIVSVYFRPKPYPHFSGNMWWSLAGHIKSCVPLTTLRETLKDSPYFYNTPEFWATFKLDPSRLLSLHQTPLYLQCEAFPYSSYKDIPPSPIEVTTLMDSPLPKDLYERKLKKAHEKTKQEEAKRKRLKKKRERVKKKALEKKKRKNKGK